MNQHKVTAETDGQQSLLECKKDIMYPVDVLNSEAGHLLPKGKVVRFQSWQGKQLFQAYEHCDRAGAGWFKTKKGKSISKLFALYKKVRLAGGNLLLSVGPTHEGIMPSGFRNKLLELKPMIEEFESSLEKEKGL